MQTTLPLRPGHPLSNITGLARQISLPGEHAPLRFPSFPALERTAVMGFNQPASLALPASTSVSVTLFRQPCWPVWADYSSSVFYAMSWFCDAISDPVTAANGNVINLEIRNTIGRVILTTTAATNQYAGVTLTGGTTPTNNYPLIGRDEGLPGREWFYAPAGYYITTVLGGDFAVGSANTGVVTYQRWSSPGELFVGLTANITIAAGLMSGAQETAITASGWYRLASASITINPANTKTGTNHYVTTVVNSANVTFTGSAVSQGVVSFTPTARTAHFPLVEPAEFANSALPWFACKVTAAALLGTNVSQVTTKGGTILAGRLSPNVANAWGATATTISNLHPAEKAYLPLETGVYTYAPPSTDLTFFHDATNVSIPGGTNYPCFMLTNDSMYNKMFITASGADELLACTVSWHIEFRTSSALFQVGLSNLSLEALHSAQLALAELGFFFENPDHKKMLGKVINAAKKYAPDVVSLINPSAGKLLHSLISRTSHGPAVIPKAGPKNPPTTSAKGSGLIPKKTPKQPKPAPKKPKK